VGCAIPAEAGLDGVVDGLRRPAVVVSCRWHGLSFGCFNRRLKAQNRAFNRRLNDGNRTDFQLCRNSNRFHFSNAQLPKTGLLRLSPVLTLRTRRVRSGPAMNLFPVGNGTHDDRTLSMKFGYQAE
jgi:hypothetical protein